MERAKHIVAPLLALVMSVLFVLAPIEPVIRAEFRLPLAEVSATSHETSTTNTATAQQSANKTGRTSCNGFYAFFSNPFSCIGRLIGSLFGALIVGISAWFLTVVGVLFNWIIEHTIVLFSSSIFSAIKGGVEGAWTAFRDVGNIVIIGMFTFMAISTILGLENFGYKKLLAKVLIIAILINFSLLFTTQIINISNFVATQFYNAMGAQGTTANNLPGAAAVAATSQTPPGVSGLFMSAMGMSGFADGFTTTWENAERSDSGLLAFINAVFGSIVLIGAAFVLLYGAFLMISRAILLVFLMLTSALAFASYLIPQLSQGGYGWKTWWTSLLQAAAFGPLIMLFLWATLLIAQAIAQASGGGSLGKLIADPTGGGNIGALFNYLIILGLLFASFKTAHVFSHNIAYFNWASMATATPFSLASRLGGVFGRNILGRAGFKIGNALGKDLAQARRLHAQMLAENERNPGSYSPERIAQVGDMMRRLESRKGIAGAFAKSDYNLMNNKSAQWLAKQAGVAGYIAGEKKVGGFDASAKKAGEDAAKRAESALLSRGDQNKIRAEASKDMASVLKQQKQALEQQKQVAEATLRSTQQQNVSQMQMLHQQKQAAEQQVRAIEQQTRATKETLQAEIDQLHRDLTHSVPGTAQEAQIRAEVARKQSAINAEDDNIRRAHKNVKDIEMHLQAIKDNESHDAEKARAAQRKIDEHERDAAKKIADHAEKTTQQAVAQAIKTGQKLAGEYGSDVVSRYLGRTSLKGAKAQDIFDDKHHAGRFKKDLEKLIEQMQNPPSPPSTGTP